MPSIRIPISSTVADGTGSVYICFAEGHRRADGTIDVKLAFALKDESRFHRTPGVECQQPDEDALASWTRKLTIAQLTAALVRALETQRDGERTIRKKKR